MKRTMYTAKEKEARIGTLPVWAQIWIKQLQSQVAALRPDTSKPSNVWIEPTPPSNERIYIQSNSVYFRCDPRPGVEMLVPADRHWDLYVSIPDKPGEIRLYLGSCDYALVPQATNCYHLRQLPWETL